MADVTLTYKGATIGELSESGIKTIETAGKYCEADILLNYAKPGGGLDDIQLVEMFDVVLPAQTSSAQTVTIPFDSSKLDYYAPNVPFLMHYKCLSEPTAPEKLTLVERWQLFSLQSNYTTSIYDRGYWARFKNTSGGNEYTDSTYGDKFNAGALITMIRITNSSILLQCKAAIPAGTYEQGLWRCRLYRLAGFEG